MKSETMKKLLIIVLLLALAAAVAYNQYREWYDANYGVGTYDSLEDYGVAGLESVPLTAFLDVEAEDVKRLHILQMETGRLYDSTHVLLTLSAPEEVEACMKLLDESFQVVNTEAEKGKERYEGLWRPYIIRFVMQDGTTVECGFSGTTELCRVLYYNGEYLNLISDTAVTVRLESEFGMLPPPLTVDHNNSWQAV